MILAALGALVLVLVAAAIVLLIAAVFGSLQQIGRGLADTLIALERARASLEGVHATMAEIATILRGPVRVEFPPAASPPAIERQPAGRSPH